MIEIKFTLKNSQARDAKIYLANRYAMPDASLNQLARIALLHEVASEAKEIAEAAELAMMNDPGDDA